MENLTRRFYVENGDDKVIFSGLHQTRKRDYLIFIVRLR